MSYSVTSIRGSLARTMYSKFVEDLHDSSMDHSHWYSIAIDQVDLQNKSLFVQLYEDAETKEFLENSRTKSDWITTQLLHSFLKFFLTFFMSSTSANGLLNRGSMFVLSSSQVQQLLDIEPDTKLENLLDLGAGDGAVTEKMTPYFANVSVTEMSQTMLWRLKNRGYGIVDTNDWDKTSERYDVISCMNLLDRCDNPLDILEVIHSKLKPGNGRLLLAVVLPFHQYIESGDGNHCPKQQLIIAGKSFEQHLSSLVNDVLHPAGYVLEKFSKVPYLCEGDLHHSYYILHDAILLLSSNRN